jgi:hypothetical protein
MSLMLHSGANTIDRATLATLPVPAPMGPRHVVRPFIDDVEAVTHLMQANGLRIKDEAFGITGSPAEPKRFFGVLECALEGEHFTAEEYSLMIGLRGSYDQTLPRGLAVGSRVFVCDNLAFSGEITLSTKQTTHLGRRIPEMLARAVGKIPALAAHQAVRFDAYRNTGLKPRWGDAALVELHRQGVLNTHQLGRAIQEWDAPSHEEHLAAGRTVWTLHNAVTEAIKPTEGRANILPAWDKTLLLTTFLDRVSGMNDPVTFH